MPKKRAEWQPPPELRGMPRPIETCIAYSGRLHCWKIDGEYRLFNKTSFFWHASPRASRKTIIGHDWVPAGTVDSPAGDFDPAAIAEIREAARFHQHGLVAV